MTDDVFPFEALVEVVEIHLPAASLFFEERNSSLGWKEDERSQLQSFGEFGAERILSAFDSPEKYFQADSNIALIEKAIAALEIVGDCIGGLSIHNTSLLYKLANKKSLAAPTLVPKTNEVLSDLELARAHSRQISKQAVLQKVELTRDIVEMYEAFEEPLKVQADPNEIGTRGMNKEAAVAGACRFLTIFNSSDEKSPASSINHGRRESSLLYRFTRDVFRVLKLNVDPVSALNRANKLERGLPEFRL